MTKKVERKISKKVLGNRIKRTRKALKMNQMQFAEILGVTFVSISNWENGKFLPHRKSINAIAEIGGVEPETLMYGKVYNPNVKPLKVDYTEVKEEKERKKEAVGHAAVNNMVVEKPMAGQDKKNTVSARHIIQRQIEDEFTSFELALKKSDADEIMNEAERLTVYRYAMRGIKARIRKKESNRFAYLGKNSILDKFYEYYMTNPFRGINDHTVESFEEVLTAVYQ